jgi:hypothetical protein
LLTQSYPTYLFNLFIHSFMFVVLDKTQSLVHARQELSHQITSPALGTF